MDIYYMCKLIFVPYQTSNYFIQTTLISQGVTKRTWQNVELFTHASSAQFKHLLGIQSCVLRKQLHFKHLGGNLEEQMLCLRTISSSYDFRFCQSTNPAEMRDSHPFFLKVSLSGTDNLNSNPEYSIRREGSIAIPKGKLWRQEDPVPATAFKGRGRSQASTYAMKVHNRCATSPANLKSLTALYITGKLAFAAHLSWYT